MGPYQYVISRRKIIFSAGIRIHRKSGHIIQDKAFTLNQWQWSCAVASVCRNLWSRNQGLEVESAPWREFMLVPLWLSPSWVRPAERGCPGVQDGIEGQVWSQSSRGLLSPSPPLVDSQALNLLCWVGLGSAVRMRLWGVFILCASLCRNL